MTKTAAIILAAGKGTRMISAQPKVLHRLGGKYLIQHVIDEAKKAGVDQLILVIGHGGEEVRSALGAEFTYAWQKEQLGTGHAVMQGAAYLDQDTERVVVLSGDVPLLRGETILDLLKSFQKEQAKAAILTAKYEFPKGYGRVVRDSAGKIQKIVEDADANSEESAIKEINSGTYCFAKAELIETLKKLEPDNAQGEYYLTDVIQEFRKKDLPISGLMTANTVETMGVNDRTQLAAMEAYYRQEINRQLMLAGVTMIDPKTVYIDAEVVVGQDTIIYPFTTILGNTSIGEGCIMGPNTTIIDSNIGHRVTIRQAVVEEAKIADECRLGPFTYLRPGTELQKRVKVGDFVEIKNTLVGEGSKVPHLTYLGDSILGKSVNVGAGTITCNYDGKNKYQTVIEDEAFIGSNSNLVAPLKIGKKAYVAAGSTLTKNVPAGSLAVAREKQRIIADWEEKKAKKED
ncbi:MAG: bifunctional UDP-N-acetylglucosamine diphosphorylase/glucosamine-1-phosphate N-acetyltransferase GlmU [Bacillota bacterium]